MARQERLFLTRNTLPLFDQLLDIMEAIPGELRSRITEEIRDTLPERSRAGDRRHSDYVGAREEIKVIDATARIRLRRPPRAAPHDAVVNLANADAPVP